MLEKKTIIAYFPIQDLGIMLGLFFGSIFLIQLLRLIIPVSGWINLAVFLLIGIYMYVVQTGLKKHHPSYLISWFSFLVFQPKRILSKPFSFLHKKSK